MSGLPGLDYIRRPTRTVTSRGASSLQSLAERDLFDAFSSRRTGGDASSNADIRRSGIQQTRILRDLPNQELGPRTRANDSVLQRRVL